MTNEPNPLETTEARKAQARVAAYKASISKIGEEELDLLFTEARTFNGWQDTELEDDLIAKLFDLTIMGATSMNCCPARFVFVKSDTMKEKLANCAAPANQPKILQAPATVVIAQDNRFFDKADFLFPVRDIKPMFENNPALCKETAFRNSSLQGAYLMIAARALGLDCGPLSGFDKQAVDKLFFEDTDITSNFLCSIGYGDISTVFPRLPRFTFSDICDVV